MLNSMLSVSLKKKELPKLSWCDTKGFKWEYIKILMYSFFIISRFVLESIFKKTSSKQITRISTLSSCALTKMTTLSLLTGIPSGNTQLWMSQTGQMLWRILSLSTTLVSTSTFSPSPVISPNRSFKHKMIELKYNTSFLIIFSSLKIFKFYTLTKALIILIRQRQLNFLLFGPNRPLFLVNQNNRNTDFTYNKYFLFYYL